MRVSGTSWSRCPTTRSPICRCPQRKALRVALLREEPEGPTPDPRAVAVACLNTLRSLSADGHVVVAVDDIQWLDPASAQAIAFAIRRLDGDFDPIPARSTHRRSHASVWSRPGTRQHRARADRGRPDRCRDDGPPARDSPRSSVRRARRSARSRRAPPGTRCSRSSSAGRSSLASPSEISGEDRADPQHAARSRRGPDPGAAGGDAARARCGRRPRRPDRRARLRCDRRARGRAVEAGRRRPHRRPRG